MRPKNDRSQNRQITHQQLRTTFYLPSTELLVLGLVAETSSFLQTCVQRNHKAGNGASRRREREKSRSPLKLLKARQTHSLFPLTCCLPHILGWDDPKSAGKALSVCCLLSVGLLSVLLPNCRINLISYIK